MAEPPCCRSHSLPYPGHQREDWIALKLQGEWWERCVSTTSSQGHKVYGNGSAPKAESKLQFPAPLTRPAAIVRSASAHTAMQ
jgi:hypothetical protein